ncbi:carboxylate-amine ligase [Streptosporangium carneum]|uniref:Putative glutamate--cysteine ligase 2 n=1 Tax=Streptosporangium carneum TaxID=47481 RepID=A0A9W6MAI4_9ACTN|nr:glutamate--cysteine ligase [Streptosporangium carneum]GLK07032.1 putative glutamate--cysteine ligase 2 [Streptosporangium carneum]
MNSDGSRLDGQGAAGPRFGVEEEFLVVDQVTRSAVPRAEAVLRRAGERLGTRVCGEITKLQLETRTEPCHTVAELHGQLAEARVALAAAASAEGLRIIASGTPVLGNVIPSPITEGPRQDLGTATFRGLHDELSICALHVHVELPERERAVLVSNHLRPHLPVLIALAANSPYWAERDTGYASWRTLVWNRWPVAGPPPYFTSAAHYDEFVATLQETGALVDVGTVFWDIRPSAHQPTLEIRVSDVPITAEESALVAALVRGLVVAALAAVDRGDPGPVVSAELMRIAYWRAARDGLGGHGVDVRTGEAVPAAELARRLLRLAAPTLEEHGDLELVTDWLRRLVEGGDGATRQRRAATGSGGLAGVVDHLVARTAPPLASTPPLASAVSASRPGENTPTWRRFAGNGPRREESTPP